MHFREHVFIDSGLNKLSRTLALLAANLLCISARSALYENAWLHYNLKSCASKTHKL